MFKSSFIVMTINMLSRLLGLIREMVIGSIFGATGMTDAYVSATRIPNFTIANALFCPYKITSVNDMYIWYSGVEYSYGKLTGMVKHARYIN